MVTVRNEGDVVGVIDGEEGAGLGLVVGPVDGFNVGTLEGRADIIIDGFTDGVHVDGLLEGVVVGFIVGVLDITGA